MRANMFGECYQWRICKCFALVCTAAFSTLHLEAYSQGNASVSGIQIQKTWAAPKNQRYPIVLSYLSWRGLPTLVGRINDSDIPERIVVDTGLNASTVTVDLLTRYTLPGHAGQVQVNAFDRITAAPEITMKSLLIGRFQFQNTLAAVLNVPDLISLERLPDAPAFWMGTSLLYAFQAEFDFNNHTLTLNAPKTPFPKNSNTIVVPITIRDGRVWVKAVIPGAKPFLALVDTGTLGTLIPKDTASKLKFKSSIVVNISHKRGQDAKAVLATVPRLLVGKAEVKDVAVAFYTGQLPSDYDPTMGVLGLDFLSNFIVTIDFASSKMALTRPDSPELPPETDTPIAPVKLKKK